MAKQTKSKKQVLLEKQAKSAMFWPDLPKMLLHKIGKESSLMLNISYGGVTKSWRAPSKQCSPNGVLPWLQLSDNRINIRRNYDDVTQPADQFNITFHRGFIYWPCRWPFQGPGGYFLGYSHNTLVTRGVSDHIYLWYLLEGYGRSYYTLPAWDPRIPFMRAILSSFLKDDSTRYCTVMVSTGINHPAFVSYRLIGKRKMHRWVKQDCTLNDPHCQNRSGGGKFLQFTNAIGFKGRFYALSLQGTVAEIIVDDDCNLRIKALSSGRAIPTVFSNHFTEYLVESEGRILLVFLISRKTTKVVDYVEVFRLNIEDLSWKKMVSLGEKTLFLGTNCCLSVSTSKARCRRNCVYFSTNTDDGWWEFDMEKSNISLAWNDCTTESPLWVETMPEE